MQAVPLDGDLQYAAAVLRNVEAALGVNRNPFLDTEDDHLSTFAMDVDTASYTVTRNYLMNYSQRPEPDGVRPEEFINYFDAGYDTPAANDAFAIYLDAAPAPFGY